MTSSIIKNQSELKHIYNITLNHSLYIFFSITKLRYWWNNQCYHPNPNPSSSLSVTTRHMSRQTHDPNLKPPFGHSYSPPPPQPPMHSVPLHSNLSSSCSCSSLSQPQITLIPLPFLLLVVYPKNIPKKNHNIYYSHLGVVTN